MPYIEQDKVDEKTRKKLEAIIEKSYATFWKSKRLFDIFFATLILLFFLPFILLLITQIFNWLKKTSLFRPMVEKLENRAMSKKDQIEKYEFWGLVLFVGIPLPGTGAWTGALIASLLDIDIKKSSLAIFCGIIMATVIMYIVSYGVVGSVVS